MPELDYEHWLNFYGRLFDADFDPENPSSHVFEQAVRSHILAVFDPLRDLIRASTQLSGILKEQQALYYVIYGAGRRYRMIWEAYRTIIHTAPIDRKEPLSNEEIQETNRDLNILYINLRGVLDNLAWTCLFERAPKIAFDLDNDQGRRRVGLFSGRFRSVGELNSLNRSLEPFSDWYFSVAERRDPSTHRIPLTIPTIANDGEAEEWRKLMAEANEGFKKLDLDAIDRAHRAAEKVGKFVPVFIHNPADGAVPLYPTIPSDMANLVRVSRAVFDFLASK